MEEEILEQVPEEDTEGQGLRQRLAAAEAENRLYRMAPDLGVSYAAVPYLARLCPPGEMDDEGVRAALEKILNDLPGLRRQTGEPRRGFRVGAGAAGAKNADEELLRAAFGIK